MTAAALAGVRVLDLGHYLAGPLCGALLAEQGADVVHVTPPGGDRWKHAANAYLHRGKSVVALDLKSDGGRREARQLAERADVVIDNFRPGTLSRLGVIRDEELGQRVWVSLPGFASCDARSAERAWEGIVGAAAGLFTDVHVTRDFLGLPPVYSALPLASIYGAVHGALATVAALVRRDRTSGGTRIEVPLADALFAAMGSFVMHVERQPKRYDIPPVSRLVRRAVMPLIRGLLAHAGGPMRDRARHAAARLVPPLMDSYAAADGRLLYLFAMDHATIPARLCATLGVHEELVRLGFVFEDPSDAASVGCNVNDGGRLTRRRRARLRTILSRAIGTRPAIEWERTLNAAGAPAAVQRSSREWLDWEPVTQAGLVTTVSDDEYGAVTMPGLSVLVGQAGTPRARRTTSVEDALGRWSGVETPRGSGDAHDATALPFSGMRVVEVASVVAAPIAARTLGEYGAEVWKIESPRPHHGPRLTRWYGIEVNQGKQSLVLDLKEAGGRAELGTLLSAADVLIHNLRPAAALRCGLDDASLRDYRRLVVATVSAYGGPRPSSFDEWPGYDPVLQAATGIMVRYGTPERPELHAIASCVDYLTGYLTAFGVACSLFARARAGETPALPVRASLAQGAQVAQAPLLVRANGTLPQVPEGQGAAGPASRERIFKASDGYVYAWVAVPGDQPKDRDRGPPAQDEALARWIRSMTVSEVSRELAARGGVAHPVRSFRESPRAVAAEDDPLDRLPSMLVVRRSHPEIGTVTTVRASYARATPPLIQSLPPAPPKGSHDPELAGRLGLSPAPRRASEPYLPR
jgi:crotonobetainyl-CoA:carnitine CoA-transferase CaiB-like acyl-CoA transferase